MTDRLAWISAVDSLKALDTNDEWFDDVSGTLARVSLTDVDRVLLSDEALLDVIGDDLAVVGDAADDVVAKIRVSLRSAMQSGLSVAASTNKPSRGNHGVSMSRVSNVFG
jgi:hypothetical protein